ncbi:MAG: DsbE family thiol:disulfide interchange protein [Gammaproteobacteria bacterium]|nr:DsbE family thiol:disulfide interchange protein [Gammaproteobacteria bacterium]
MPLVIAAAIALLWFAVRMTSPGHSAPAALPAFSLPRLDAPESLVDASALRGRPRLLNVWASWCIGCRREHDVLLRLARTGTIEVSGIAWRDDPRDARRWLEQLGNPFALVMLDADGAVAARLGVTAAPESLLIGADGAILRRHAGPLTEEIWRAEFAPALSAAVPPATAVPAAKPR